MTDQWLVQDQTWFRSNLVEDSYHEISFKKKEVTCLVSVFTSELSLWTNRKTAHLRGLLYISSRRTTLRLRSSLCSFDPSTY
jgi:hypothetical protein